MTSITQTLLKQSTIVLLNNEKGKGTAFPPKLYNNILKGSNMWKKTFVFIVLIGFHLLNNNLYNLDVDSLDPFFTYFKIKKHLLSKNINGFTFEERPGFQKISIYQNKIGFLINEKENLYFYVIDIESGKQKKFLIKFKNEDALEKPQNYIVSFGFNSNYLVLSYLGKIFIGEFDKGSKEIILSHQGELEKNIMFIKVFSDKAVFWKYGYSKEQKELDSKGYCFILNFNSKKINKIILPVPEGFFFTLFYPPHCLDVSSKYIAYSEITSYNIKIFDLEGKLVIKILRKDTLFNELNEELKSKFSSLINSSNISVKSSLDSMRNAFFGGYGVIEKVNFINDSILLVRWYGPKIDTNKWYPEIYYDLWKIQDETVTLLAKNIKAKEPEDEINVFQSPLYASLYETGFNYIVKFRTTFSQCLPSKSETLGAYRKRSLSSRNSFPNLFFTVYEYIN